MKRKKPGDDLSSWLHSGVREIFRDENLWILDKPSGVLSHPNPPGGKAPNALLRAPYRFKEEAFELMEPAAGGEQARPRRVYLVHRLDQETSGLIVCAFHERAAALLKEALFHHEILKEYRALLLGRLEDRRAEWADRLEKVSEGSRVTVRARGRSAAKNARTRVAVLERVEPAGLSLVAFWPETGRTHQLRVQAAARHLPIGGDGRYGDFTANRFLSAETGLKRMFLHAIRLEFRHPMSGHAMKFHAPMTSRLSEPLRRARELTRPIPRRKER